MEDKFKNPLHLCLVLLFGEREGEREGERKPDRKPGAGLGYSFSPLLMHPGLYARSHAYAPEWWLVSGGSVFFSFC